MVIEFSGIVIEFSVMVVEFSGMVIEIRSKLVETITSKHYFTIIFIFGQIATDFDEWSSNSVEMSSNSVELSSNSVEWSSNSDEWSSKSEQIGQNNHLQTLFHTHSYILSYRKSVQQNSITSKHYFTLIPIISQIENGLIKTQSPPNTISHSPKHFKPSQAKSVRECGREKRTA